MSKPYSQRYACFPRGMSSKSQHGSKVSNRDDRKHIKLETRLGRGNAERKLIKDSLDHEWEGI